MIKVKDSNCEDSVFEHIDFICDKCGKHIRVKTTDEMKFVDQTFDLNDDKDELFCKECANPDSDRSWFFSHRPEDEKQAKGFDEWVKTCNQYGLLSEVIELTKCYVDGGQEFTNSFNDAMSEWDM